MGVPPGAANTLEMSEAQLRELYPDGPKALPPVDETLVVGEGDRGGDP